MICYLWHVYCVHRAFVWCFTYAYLYVALKMFVFIFERWMSFQEKLHEWNLAELIPTFEGM